MSKLPEMKKHVEIPEKVTIEKNNDTITVKGEKGELFRNFSHPKINLAVKDKTVEISAKNVKKKDKAIIGTWEAHIRNMIKGVSTGFEYKMKTVYSHFPIKTTVEGNSFIIKNFLGEKSPRKAKILEGVTVEAKGDDITVKGFNREKVGQTVANIERATAVKRRDIRVFQDGVYLISKEVSE